MFIEQINDTVNSLDQVTQQNANIANETAEISKSTNNIAKQIVEDANKKEFRGKDFFKNDNNITPKKVIIEQKKEIILEKSKNTNSFNVKKTTIIESKNKNDEEWESF